MPRSPSRPGPFVWVGPDDDTTPPDARPAPAAASDVHFVDERTDMAAVYSAFDVFVLASYREGFSRASMEAAACGVPMVLTDIRGCREVGTHGEHLLLVPPQDAGAIADAVARLLEDAGLRARLGAAARNARERSLRPTACRPGITGDVRHRALPRVSSVCFGPADRRHPFERGHGPLMGTAVRARGATRGGWTALGDWSPPYGVV